MCTPATKLPARPAECDGADGERFAGPGRPGAAVTPPACAGQVVAALIDYRPNPMEVLSVGVQVAAPNQPTRPARA
jgi:hypothetical protein